MCYVDVYPIKRLPRRFGAFTYSAPESSSPSLTRGSFVIIPWRSGLVRGVVAERHDRSSKDEIKMITETLPETITSTELAVYEATAKETFQSVSSILDSAFPKPRKRNISKRDRAPRHADEPSSEIVIPRKVVIRMESLAKQGASSFVPTTDLIDTALLVRFLTKHRKGPILFLVPHAHDLDVANELLLAWNLTPSLCTSDLTEAQRYDLATAWRAGEIPLLLSTRLGSLFLPPKNLGGVVVGRSGILEHAQYDRNPRYDARRFAQAWSALHGCPLLICDTLARCADLHHPEPRSVAAIDPDIYSSNIINLTERIRFGDDPLLTESLRERIDERLKQGKRILLICNQKGLGAKMTCKDCGFVETCGTCQQPLSIYETHLFCAPCKRATKKPDTCRKCRSANLKAVRRGTGALAKLITTHWPDVSIHVVEKSGSALSVRRPLSQIIIATSFYYENIYQPHRDLFGLIALVCGDQEVRLEGDLSHASRRLLEYQGIAIRSKAPFLIQTWDPKLVRRLLESPLDVLEEECSAKKDLELAPFTTELELTSQGKDGFYKLNQAVSYAKASEKTHITSITPGRWKILTKSDKLLKTLREMDDSLVVSNKTWL